MSRRRARLATSAVVALAALGTAGAVSAPAMDGMPGMHDHGGGTSGGATATTGPKVSIGFAAFAAPRLDVVTGDRVEWMNDSARAHDVVAGDQSFDSGRMVAGDAFAHRFGQEGTVPYYCSLHPFMTGEVDVHPLLLDAPKVAAGAGKPYILSGRAGTGIAGTVTIEGDDGSGFEPAGTAAVAADGTFRTSVVPRTTTAYRAVSGEHRSPAAQVLVVDHQVSVTARHRGRTTTIAVRVAPADPGAPVVLQLRLRDRFGWWPVQRARLDARSTARFVLRRGSAVPGRVLLTLPDGATELARSATVPVGPSR